MKRVMCVLLMIVFCGAFLMSCSMPLKNSKEVKQRIVVQLDQDYWLASVGRMLKEHFPDVEFDFVISRGGAQYLNDAAGVEGILANTELFDEYGIQLPYNYDTFVEACNKFGEYGIRGFATDYKYDYTDSYMLQAWSIPLLQSSKGRIWRNDASEGNVDYLPDELGTQLFSRLEQVFKDTGVQVEDVSRGYSVAMNGKLKGAGKREELALDIVRYFFSSEVMNAMADMLIAPAAMNAGDIYKGDYTAAQLQALIMGGGVKFYTKDATGTEIKNVVRCLVEGCGRDDDPISWDTLPASSGFTMKISRDDDGKMHLLDIIADGESIADEKTYSFCYVDVSGHTLLERAYNYDMSEHGGVHMYKQDTDIKEGEKYDGYIVHTTGVSEQWLKYFIDGGKLPKPQAYIEKS